MTDQHPLTDEIIEEIAHSGYIDDYGRYNYAADDLRAVADWQLEQVLKWLNETILERGCSFEAVNIPEELQEAMRPQKNSCHRKKLDS